MLLRSTLRRLLLAGGALTALHPGAVRAQAVNYGALEELFGQPVTTSVTGKPQLASQVPGDLVIITHDQIRQSGATDIPSILQFVTGIDVRQYTFGDTQIGIRGYNSPFNPRLLVLVDGRQVYLDDYGYVAWNDIPVQLDEIRQIEVVKGPASALFGFNAASGVINIVTYDPLLDKVNTATVSGGTQGYGQGDAVATQHFGTTAGVRVSVGGWTASTFNNPYGDASAPSPRYASFNASGRWQVLPDVLIRFEGGDLDTHTERFDDLGAALATQDQISFWRIGAAANTGLGALDLDVYRNSSLINYLTNTSDNEVLVAKATDLIKASTDNTIRLGVEYRSNSIEGLYYVGGISYNDFAVDAMWDWQIAPWVDLTNAVRLDYLELHDNGPLIPTPGRSVADYNNTTITGPSFNSGLVFKVSDLDTVRVTAARGLQVPSLLDFGIQIGGFGYYYLGAPYLQPVAVWDAELAYDRTLPMLGATFTSAVFFQRNTDLLAPAGGTPFVPVGDIVGSAPANIGSSNEIGVEVGLRGKTQGGVRWNVSYQYASINEDIIAAVKADPTPQTSPANGTPRHAVIVGAGYTTGKWEFDVQGRWQSSFTDYMGNEISASPILVSNYVTFNARIGYSVTKYLTLAGTAEQFNDARIIESAGDYVDRRFIASANVKF